MPILGSLAGFNDQFFTKMFALRVQTRTQLIGRPPTQDEASAMAFWVAKQVSLYSYGTPVGLVGGWWRAWGTRNTFRFPFYQPNMETFEPRIFPPRLGFLSGNRALMAWHALRFAAYGGAGQYVGQILFGSYSMTVASVGEMQDNRLKDMNNAVRAQARKRNGALEQVQVGKPGATSAQQTSTVAVGRNEQQDDASPSGGMYFDEGRESGSIPDERMGGGNIQQDQSRKKGWPVSRAPSQPSSTQEPREQQFEDFDDASPTGGQGPRADTASSGSAWDRIRSGSNTRPSGQREGSAWPTNSDTPASQSGQSAWSKLQNYNQEEPRQSSADSFTYNKKEEERSLAKSEAQKEFDARIERERRGGDFNSGNGDQRRW